MIVQMVPIVDGAGVHDGLTSASYQVLKSVIGGLSLGGS
jgi:hypothetical protein